MYKAFTLVELLATIAVVASLVLVVIMSPMLCNTPNAQYRDGALIQTIDGHEYIMGTNRGRFQSPVHSASCRACQGK